MNLEIADFIKNAKLGRTRQDAQIDTCAVFAAALYDTLSDRKIPCKIVIVACSLFSRPEWYHSVVEAYGRQYDSMGEFSEEILRKRAKIHPTVSLAFSYYPDTRKDCYESEFDDLFTFYMNALSKAFIAAHPFATKEGI